MPPRADRWDEAGLRLAVRAALACAQEQPRGGARVDERTGTVAVAQAAIAPGREQAGARALRLLSLVLAEQNGWLEPGSCARWAALGAAARDRDLREGERISALAARSRGALPLGEDFPSARSGANTAAGEAGPAGPARGADGADAETALLALTGAPIESLATAYEALAAASRGRAHRRERGVYYTPPEVAAEVVSLAFAHAELPARPRLFDCCAGAGLFLLEGARALEARGATPSQAVSLCGGSDLDPRALAVTRALLALYAGPPDSNRAPEPLAPARSLAVLDALQKRPSGAPIDLLITNPPYGHAAPRDREALIARYPALRGGEIDLYAAFILRALELVRPGGVAALLVPDTWMTNARSSMLRAAVLEQARLCAVADLGKPFAAARDTRVQALVLQRRDGLHATHLVRPIFSARMVETREAIPPLRESATQKASDATARTLLPLAPIDESELRARVGRGWQPYCSHGERALAGAMEAASVPLEQLCRVGYGLRTGDNARHVARGAGGPGAIGLVGGEEIEPFILRRKEKWLRAPTPDLLRLCEKQRGAARVAVQRIRTNAQAPWARWLEAAPIPPGLVCLDSLSTLSLHPTEDTRPPDASGATAVATAADDDLLWALLGLFASVALNRFHRLRTTDVNVKPSALRALPAPQALADAAARAPLVALCKARAKELDEGRAHLLERRIDRAVYQLYSLDESQIDEAERGFWGERFEAERALLPRL